MEDENKPVQEPVITQSKIRGGIQKADALLKVSAGQFHLPVNLSLQNIIIALMLAAVVWFTAEEKIKSTYARLFPKIDWNDPPDIDMSSDRGRLGCYVDYLSRISPKSIEICDNKFSK